MAADSVGQIGLDLVVNQGQFKQQMASIQGLAKKAGAALATAFAAKKLVDFGAQCIELGSRLAEVDNVIQQAVPSMQKQIDSFAKNAIEQFGMSETSAKKFTGVFASMSRGFGFSEKSAASMGMTLTGLAADVASFYDTSQEEAFTKLKSVFTGETETLKDLGIVMTQSALDSYALANGYGKVTSKMSEMEKVALRYAFVQEKLQFAQGDFARTSGSWANQVRTLAEQFNALKGVIGQGLINVLTPVIKVINTIIGKLMSLANAFKAFTEMITGKGSSGGGASAAAAGMEAVAQSADKANAAAGGAGSAAKKAAKDMKSITTGIDELNIISPDTGSDSGGSGGGAAGGYDADQFDMGEVDTSAMDAMDSKYQALIDRAKELKNLFTAGFWDGFGDTTVFDNILTSVDRIKQSLGEIFTAPEVLTAANSFADQFSFSLGQVAGSITSIGMSLADFLIGSIDKYLSKNRNFLKDKIIALFDIGSEVSTLVGELSVAVSEIFAVLRLDSFKDIGASLVAIFTNTVLNLLELFLRVKTDVFEKFAIPIIENKDKIIEALTGLGDFLAPLMGLIADVFTYVGQKINDVYEGIISPVFSLIAQLISEKVSFILEVFNSWFLPVLQHIGDKIQELRDGAFLQLSGAFDSLIEKVSEFVQTATGLVQTLLNQYLMPFVEWIIHTMAPYITGAINIVVDAFFAFLEAISGVLNGVLTALGGVIDFIAGVFTGEWGLAWEGIKEIFSGVWETIKAIVSGAIGIIQSVVTQAWTAISGATSSVWNQIKALLNTIWSWLKSLAGTLFDGIKNAITTAWENVRNTTSEIWEGIKATLGTLWDTIKTAVDEKFTAMKDAITGVWDTVKTKTKETWDGIWADIKGIINMIIGGVESMANRVIDAINAMIDAVNEVADKVPGIGADLIPNIPSISLPRLAQGGFVRANTPQLAMIGDNRHYGEIVAPEDKMQEMVDRAVAMSSRNSSGMSDQYLVVMVDLLRKIIELIEQMDLTVYVDIREIKKQLADLEKRSGYKLRPT